MINDITDELEATIKLIEEVTDALTEDGVCTGQDSSVVQELQRLVKKMPRNSLNIPIQWFEMDCTYGWGKMMLIMGYEDNRKLVSILEATVAEDPFTVPLLSSKLGLTNEKTISHPELLNSCKLMLSADRQTLY